MKSGEAEDGRDSKVVGAYRAASDALDERPSPAARAAILAAAARAVDAQPRDAATGAPSHRASAPRAAVVVSKRPLALVASVLVATVAIVLSTNVERELPEKSTVPITSRTERVGETDGAAALRQPKLEADKNESPRVDPRRDKAPGTSVALAERERQPAPATNDVAPRANVPAAAPAQKPDAPGVGVPAPRVPPARSAPGAAHDLSSHDGAAAGPSSLDSMKVAKSVETPQSAEAHSAASRAEQKAAQDATPSAPGLGASTASGAPVAPPLPGAETPTTGTLARAPAPASSEEARVRARVQAPVALQGEPAGSAQLARVSPAEALPVLDAEVTNDPARWLKRIVALRDAGLDEQADRELAQWRQRYPAIDVPANALRRAGTR